MMSSLQAVEEERQKKAAALLRAGRSFAAMRIQGWWRRILGKRVRVPKRALVGEQSNAQQGTPCISVRVVSRGFDRAVFDV